MGRERQKFKNRSSVSKAKLKTKSKKQILNNPIIAANWNQNESIAQNYRRLGLARKLNHSAGGTEALGSNVDEETRRARVRDDSLVIKSKQPTQIEIGEAKIQRDPTTGAIISFEDNRKANPLNDKLNDIEDEDEAVWEGFVNDHGVVDGAAPSVPGAADTDVVKQLEARAAMGSEKKPRKQSEREQDWIGRLVEKYGDDYGKMSRDMKLNPMQQSSGDIKRRVKKWKATHAAEEA
ncbi:hypothetical protein MBLNU457_6774t1 [Dothideomycetes sp. NU457]